MNDTALVMQSISVDGRAPFASAERTETKR